MTWLDNTVALRQLETAHNVRKQPRVYPRCAARIPCSDSISALCEQIAVGRKPVSERLSSIPRVITLGGDHTTTLSALRAAFKRWGKLSVIHFDAHIGAYN